MNLVCAWGGTKRQRLLVEEVANFCIQKLMPRMRTLDICINLENFGDDDAVGYCLAVDKREFVIEVHKGQTKEDLISTITHEMVHVKQYARCELNPNDTKEDPTPYADRWYEKEAYALQDVLANQFVQKA